jgi:methionyl-tRNA synthetase
MWQAMLMSAGLPNSKQILIHGFITSEGQKMSKSLGNVIDPFEIIERYGIDPTRYYLLREIPSDEDGDFSYKKLEDRYNGDLANNLGNLVSRVAKLIETKLEGKLNFEDRFLDGEVKEKFEEIEKKYHTFIKEFRLHDALAQLWELFNFANVYINDKKPWAESEHPEHLIKTLTSMIYAIISGARLLEPFLPETSRKIFKIFGYDGNKKDLNGLEFEVVSFEALFPRIN